MIEKKKQKEKQNKRKEKSIGISIGWMDETKRTIDDYVEYFSWAVLFMICSYVFYSYWNQGIDVFFNHFNQITNIASNMSIGFGIITIILFMMMVLERIFPDQKLPHVPGWWVWVLGINLFQLFAVILATFTWEKWLQHTEYFQNMSSFHLRDYVSPVQGGFIAYVINCWLFYYWHRARHSVYILWLLCHQLHHSATRLETITSFYKHPLEILLDSQIMAVMLYSVLGLSSESSIWLSLFSACGEYFYHMNISTPHWLGYFIQRPESHRLHHYRCGFLLVH